MHSLPEFSADEQLSIRLADHEGREAFRTTVEKWRAIVKEHSNGSRESREKVEQHEHMIANAAKHLYGDGNRGGLSAQLIAATDTAGLNEILSHAMNTIEKDREIGQLVKAYTRAFSQAMARDPAFRQALAKGPEQSL